MLETQSPSTIFLSQLQFSASTSWSKMAAWPLVIMAAFQLVGRKISQTCSSPFLLIAVSKRCTPQFHLHFMDRNLATWSYLAARETEKYPLSSRWRCATLKLWRYITKWKEKMHMEKEPAVSAMPWGLETKDDLGVMRTPPSRSSRNLCLESHDCFAVDSLRDTGRPIHFTEP